MAGFARLQSVSRKTVYEWKDKGYLVFAPGGVDIEASNARLAAAGLSRLQPGKLKRAASRQARRLPAEGDRASDQALLRHARQFPTVLAMSVFAASVADLALDLLDHLPIGTVRELMDRHVEQGRRSAYEIALHSGEGPPPGFASWSDHPWFTEPALTEAEWQEIQGERARGRGL